MCSYMAMFPPNLPHYFIQRCTRPGDVVLDPFSGRGTTPLEACLEGRIGVGNDLNDLAYALTRAKVNVPPSPGLRSRLAELEQGYSVPESVRPLLERYNDLARQEEVVSRETWERLRSLLVEIRKAFAERGDGMPYYRDEDYEYRALRSQDAGYTEDHHHRIWLFIHPATLHQLTYLKKRLGDCPCDDFIRATVLGIMHGRGRFFLSIPMPNTFSMTPRYVLSYAYNHRLVIPDRNVFACLRAKLELMGVDAMPASYLRGEALRGDVRLLPDAMAPLTERYGKKPKLLVTSPPYLGVIKYGQYNWIRLWFLDDGSDNVTDDDPGDGGAARHSQALDRLTDSRLDDGHKDLAGYLSFAREAMAATYRVMDDECLAAWVVGDVSRSGKPGVNLAEEVWKSAAEPEGWRLLGVIADEVMENRKVTKIWGESRGKATQVDRVLLLYKDSWPDYGGSSSGNLHVALEKDGVPPPKV